MQLRGLSMMDGRQKFPILFYKDMTFFQGVKKLFTTPVYLFGENTEKSEEQEEKELMVKDESGEVKWYDKVFSWPIFLGTWLIQMFYITPFEYPKSYQKIENLKNYIQPQRL